MTWQIPLIKQLSLAGLLVCVLLVLVPMDAGAEESLEVKVERMLQEKDLLLQQNRHNEAYELLKKVTEIAPDDPIAYYHLAVIHFMRNEYKQGIPLVRRSVELMPENLGLRQAYARALREGKQYEEAIVQYKLLVQRLPQDGKGFADADKQLSLLLLQKAVSVGDTAEFDSLASELMANYGNNPAVVYRLGDIYFNKYHRYDKAEQAYQRLVELRPNNPVSHYNLGNVYDAQGRLLEAEQAYSRVFKLNPDPKLERIAEIKLKVVQGLRLLKEDDVVISRQAFERVIELDPRHVIANMNLGLLYIESEELALAANAFENVLRVEPLEFEARLRLATVYLDMGEAIDAVRELDRVVQQSGDNNLIARATNVLSILERTVGAQRMAGMRGVIDTYALLDSELKADPNNVAALYNRAELLHQEGDREAAMAALLKVIDIDPNHVDSRVRLGSLYEEQDDYIKAAEQYGYAVSLMDENGRFVFDTNKGALPEPVVTRQNQRFQAIRNRLWSAQAGWHMSGQSVQGVVGAEVLYNTILEVSPDDPSALWGMAQAKSKEGHLEEAAGFYERMLERSPGNLRVVYRLAGLYERLSEEEKSLPLYGQILVDVTAKPELKKIAAKRAEAIRRKLNGISYNLAYSLATDDNSQSSDRNKTFEYRSDTTGAANYNYKLKKNLSFSLNVSGSYQVYHVQQYDFFHLNLSPSLVYDDKKYSLTAAWQRSSQYGVLRENDTVTRRNNFILNGSYRPSGRYIYQGMLSYQTYASEVNPFIDANTTSANIVMYIRDDDGLTYNLGYTLISKDNNNDLGNDYANISNALKVGVNRWLNESLSVNGSFSAGFDWFKNMDSSVAHRYRRKNIVLQFTAGANYRINDRYSLNGGYSYMRQRSTLPVGVGLTGTSRFEQGSSLGTFQRRSLNAGLRVSF